MLRISCNNRLYCDYIQFHLLLEFFPAVGDESEAIDFLFAFVNAQRKLLELNNNWDTF